MKLLNPVWDFLGQLTLGTIALLAYAVTCLGIVLMLGVFWLIGWYYDDRSETWGPQ